MVGQPVGDSRIALLAFKRSIERRAGYLVYELQSYFVHGEKPRPMSNYELVDWSLKGGFTCWEYAKLGQVA